MKNFNAEMIEKAKTAKSAEELLEIAKAKGVALTKEEANVYYEQLNAHREELSEEELNNVAGGGCGDPEVPCYGRCEHWICRRCGTPYSGTVDSFADSKYCHNCIPWRIVSCENCKYSYQGGTNDMITYCSR